MYRREWHCIAWLCWCAVKNPLTHSLLQIYHCLCLSVCLSGEWVLFWSLCNTHCNVAINDLIVCPAHSCALYCQPIPVQPVDVYIDLKPMTHMKVFLWKKTFTCVIGLRTTYRRLVEYRPSVFITYTLTRLQYGVTKLFPPRQMLCVCQCECAFILLLCQMLRWDVIRHLVFLLKRFMAVLLTSWSVLLLSWQSQWKGPRTPPSPPVRGLYRFRGPRANHKQRN